MNMTPLPAFHHRSVWLLHDGQRALVVDPGDAGPVRNFLATNGLQLEAILVTRHDTSPAGGLEVLRGATGAQAW
jgi:hydroxyacylglutathione hydrolase